MPEACCSCQKAREPRSGVSHEAAPDGEAFAEGFHRLKLGKVIGTRGWGGEFWLRGSKVQAALKELQDEIKADPRTVPAAPQHPDNSAVISNSVGAPQITRIFFRRQGIFLSQHSEMQRVKLTPEDSRWIRMRLCENS
jgi:hypothetical protein